MKPNGTVIYDGIFMNNVPHGKGKIEKDGNMIEREWV